MQLDKLTVNIRPIAPAEAVDLGLAVAQAWFWSLWGLGVYYLRYLLVGVALVVLWAIWAQRFSLTLLLSLLLLIKVGKLYAEQGVLLFLSQKLFDEKLAPAQFRAQTQLSISAFMSMIFRFMSSLRIMSMAVRLLEGQTGRAAKMRLSVLGRQSSSALFGHALVCWLLEGILTIAMVSFLATIGATPVGEGVLDNWMSAYNEENYGWAAGLVVLVYAVVVSMLLPFFVAGGFCVYLCRRSLLEAWDVELTFRKIAQRFFDRQHQAPRDGGER